MLHDAAARERYLTSQASPNSPTCHSPRAPVPGLQAWEEGADDDNDPDRFNAPATMFDSSKHYLHGIVHLNACGHLQRVNGREGGSVKLNGRQLMAIWDSLCKLLRVREVSLAAL